MSDAQHQPEADDRRKIEADAEEIFLSPRVLDQAAFEEFSTRLTALLDETRRQSTSLAEQVRAAESLRSGVESVGDRARARIEQSTELLTKLNERATAIGALLEKAGQRAEGMQQVETQIDELIESRIVGFEERLEKSVDAAMMKLEQRIERAVAQALDQAGKLGEQLEERIERTAESQREKIQMLDSQLGRIEAQLAKSVRREEDADASPATLAEVIERAESLASCLAERLATIETTQNELEQHLARCDEAIGESSDRAEAALSRHAELKSAFAQLDQAGAEVEEKLNSQMSEAIELLESVGGVLNRARESQSSLAERIEEAVKIRDVADSLLRRLQGAAVTAESLERKLDPWTGLLLEGRSEVGPLPEALQQIVDEFRGEVLRDLSRMASAMSLVAEKGSRSAGQTAQVQPSSRSSRIVVRRVGDHASAPQDDG